MLLQVSFTLKSFKLMKLEFANLKERKNTSLSHFCILTFASLYLSLENEREFSWTILNAVKMQQSCHFLILQSLYWLCIYTCRFSIEYKTH